MNIWDWFGTGFRSLWPSSFGQPSYIRIDTGCGIAPVEIQRLNPPFYAVPSRLEPAGGLGTGTAAATAGRSQDNAHATDTGRPLVGTGAADGAGATEDQRQPEGSRAAVPGRGADNEERGASSRNPSSGTPLSEEQQQRVTALKQRDQEVRAHEAAHLAAAGGYAAGGAKFSYSRGPDGRLYATGGEVPIDISAVPGDPQATLIKAQTVQRAALAPAEPSGQDRQVAAQAAAMAADARRQLAKQGLGESGSAANEGTHSLRSRLEGSGALDRSGPERSRMHLVA